jgi:hypothetical protein
MNSRPGRFPCRARQAKRRTGFADPNGTAADQCDTRQLARVVEQAHSVSEVLLRVHPPTDEPPPRSA